MVPENTSFCTVSLVLIRLECGSVQTNAASISLTLLSPRSFLMQIVSSSLHAQRKARQRRCLSREGSGSARQGGA